MSMDVEEALSALRRMADPAKVQGMARFGIAVEGTLGVSMPEIKALARRIGRDHGLAMELWASGVHEARILAALVAEKNQVDLPMMEAWVRQFDSWDVCDQVCGYLFSYSTHAYEVVPGWATSEGEFVKRAGFVMMASLAVHDKKAGDKAFIVFFPLIEDASDDPRNYVKKAVNWAIRQIGKRNLLLREECVLLARRVQARGTPSARWIAADALRELTSEKVMARLESKERRRG